MDPLSLTASIVAIVGIGTTTVKLLKKLASIKNSPAIVSALDSELTDLRLSVSAIHDLLRRQAENHALHSWEDTDLGRDLIVDLTRCLRQINDFALSLDHLLPPLLASMLYPNRPAPGKWYIWIKHENKLKRLQRELGVFRIKLNALLGMLCLSTSLRVEMISSDVYKKVTDLAEPYDQDIKEQDAFLDRIQDDPPVLVMDRDSNSDGVSFSLESGHHDISTATEILSGRQPLLLQCQCRCHRSCSKKSSRYVTQALGTIFARFSGLPYLAPECNLPSCAQSCTISDVLISATYFFPTWFLTWVVSLALRRSTSGFDYYIRVLHCVPYSSLIFQCAYHGDVVRMKNLLQKRLGSPMDVTPEPQRSLLGVAASRGHGEICDLLIHAGADPLFVDFKNRCAIDIAWEAALTNYNLKKCLHTLLAFSSFEDYGLKHKLSLLHEAVLGLADVDLKSLLERTPPDTVNARDAHGQTALYWAALRGDSHAVSLLLAAGADDSIPNDRGARALTAALISSDAHCVQKILKNECDVNYRQVDGYTPLHHSCRYNHIVKIVKAFVDLGADINAKEALGYTPLMIAAFNKRTATARVLIDHQADLNAQAKNGECALHHAIMAGDQDIVRCLLEKGANFRLKTIAGETLLHYAARRHGDQALLHILESFDLKGVNVEQKNHPQNLTALQVAEIDLTGDITWLERFRALVRRTELPTLP